MNSYLIFGATGHTGGPLAQKLAEAGHSVKGITRREGLTPPHNNIQYVVRDQQNKHFLAEQLAGVDAAYVLLPPRMDALDFVAWQQQNIDAFVAAAKTSGLKRAVFLSSQGADLGPEDHIGPVVVVGNLERAVRQQLPNLSAVFLRPTYFMENFLANLPLIKHQGINGSPIRPDVAFPMIATRDIADAAAHWLLDLSFEGQQVVNLLGAESLSMQEVTARMGRAIGKPELPYIQFPADQAKQGMMQAGISESLAGLYADMDPTQFSRTERTPANTTPTSVDSFIREVFVPAYQHMA